MKNIQLKYLDSKNIFGTMNSGTINLRNITDDDRLMLMYKNDLKPSELEEYQLTKSDKNMIFANHRRAFAEANGFDWHKMFMADQVNKNGSYFEITRDYVENNSNGWTDIPEDILIITDEVPGVAIGHPVADCPVIIMEDVKNKVTAIAHCSAELIDKRMPMMIADALSSAYNTKDEDIKVHVSSCAGPTWTYDKWPGFANDKKIWEDTCAITEWDNEFKINIRAAIAGQLIERGIGQNVSYDFADTIIDKEYYSNSESRSNPDKYGRQFTGAIYQKVR